MSQEVGTSLVTYIIYGVTAVFALTVLFLSFFTIEQKHVGIVQRFGKFLRIANAGLNLKIPFIDQVTEVVSLKIEELDVEVETKTKDNVFVDMNVSVQYSVIPGREKEAFYELTSPKEQIESYVFDVVRAEVPKTALDEVFEKKDSIAEAIEKELKETMENYGYKIHKALVTNIDPDQKVKDAMNEINSAERLKLAAIEQGEAKKILQVKEAEGEAESKKLQGKGIADQRREIAKGLEESVDDLSQKTGVDSKTVMELLLTVQYYDTLKEMAASSKSNVIFTSTSPGGLKDITSQITEGIIAAEGINNKPNNSIENKGLKVDQPENQPVIKEDEKKKIKEEKTIKNESDEDNNENEDN